MRLQRIWSTLLWSSVVFAWKPKISKTTFKNLPTSLFYFDDSSSIISYDADSGIVYISHNDGASWDKVDAKYENVLDVYDHPFDPKTAFILTKTRTQWKTHDRGKTWEKFEVKFPPSLKYTPLSFNARQPHFVIYTGMSCEEGDFFTGPVCTDHTFYTKDYFENLKPLKEDSHGCIFARSTKTFKGAKDDTVLCIVNDSGSDLRTRRRVVVSDDYFKNEEFEPALDGYRQIKGVAVLATVHEFILAAVKSQGTDEMALYVSKDGRNWDRAEFPQDHGGIKEGAYTVLESTPYSIQVDVLSTRGGAPVGSLFTSNSNGTYFTRNLDGTNRNERGYVDFEQVSGIQGIYLVNKVDNYEDLKDERLAGKKKLKSMITFDDGRTFKPLRGPDDKPLHVYSVTNIHNGGRVFSSPAPGLLMAVGNTGDYLKPYDQCDLYLSTDAGLTWKRALEDAHKYEFGDQGAILAAVYDEGPTDKFKYSTNFGKKWKEFELPLKIRARALTTVPDSTSEKFLLIGVDMDTKDAVIMSIDMEGVQDRKCKMNKYDEDRGDFQKWYARLDSDGKPDCLMGHKQYYWRRKPDAECAVDEVYKDPEPKEEICKCTEEDFECDYNFVRKNGKTDDECVPTAKLTAPPGECKKPDDKYMGSSGYRKIPGNDCEGGKKLDEKVERPCSEAVSKPVTGKIKAHVQEFKAKSVKEFFYLERAESASGDDETIVLRTDKHEVFISHDHGGEWKQLFKDEDIVAIYPHMYFPEVVYFLTPSKKVLYTTDRGKTFDYFETPVPPNRQGIPVLSYHPQKKNWLIYTGSKGCEGFFDNDCQAVAYYSTNNGAEWRHLQANVKSCQWMRSKDSELVHEKLIFCEKWEKKGKPEGNHLQLLATTNFFEDEKVHFKDIIGFAAMNEFIIVAEQNGDSLGVQASVDGKTFAEAKFPPNFQVKRQQAYTILESITHSVFLHVTVNPLRGAEYGTIVKSNSNGTSYVKSLDGVNRNSEGYVDFEKMQGLEGVIIVNTVQNLEDVSKGAKKKLKSMITHNDGSRWDYLTAPRKDSKGKEYNCDVGDKDKCSLNLHGYTERRDPRDTFSSGSAVGLMIGVGNVGEYLTGKDDGDTFLTRDGGITWKEIKKGSYMWEYGDQGSIIVIVEENKETDKLWYSLDEGENWQEYDFGDKIYVEDITTIPSDTSRKFLLWGRPSSRGEKIITVQLDFSGLTDTKCILKENGEGGDFELWSPQHPLQESGCLFGHKAQYFRKIPSHNCYIGPKITQPHKLLQNCACTREDFECDFNYERQPGGTCALVPGLPKPDNKKLCEQDKNRVEYYEPTGYRRIPLTTCEGGQELDKSTPIPCPGKEDEFKKKHSASGVAIFFGVIFAIGLAGGIGYWVYNNWSGKFGAIRLGDDTSMSSGPDWKEYPIIALSAVVAVAMATPVVLRAIGGWVGRMFTRERRYTTRSSFARGGYAPVANDEGELLGDDDDEDDVV